MKFFLSYIFAILSLSLTCCGQKGKKEPVPSYQPVIPEKPIRWVTDFDSIFTSAEAGYLDSIVNTHEIQTTNEVAVVTLQLDSFQIKTSEDFDRFSISLFKKWGVGKKDKGNGVGILISTKLRKIRIEVGTGLESKLSDREAKKIIDNTIIPEFKNGNYYAGVLKGLQAIFKLIE